MEKFYSDNPLTFGHMMQQCFKAYPRVFKSILMLLIPFAFIHLLDAFALRMPLPINIISFLLLTLIAIAIFATMLYVSDKALAGRKVDIKEAIAHTKSRYLNILFAVLLLIIIHGIFWGITFLIGFVGEIYYAHTIAIITLFLLQMFVAISVIFTLPLVMVRDFPALKALKESIHLVHNHFWYSFGAIICMFLILALLGSVGFPLHVYDNHVHLAIFDFIIYIIGVPFTIATLLVLMRELRAEHAIEDQGGIVQRQ